MLVLGLPRLLIGIAENTADSSGFPLRIISTLVEVEGAPISRLF